MSAKLHGIERRAMELTRERIKDRLIAARAEWMLDRPVEEGAE